MNYKDIKAWPILEIKDTNQDYYYDGKNDDILKLADTTTLLVTCKICGNRWSVPVVVYKYTHPAIRKLMLTCVLCGNLFRNSIEAIIRDKKTRPKGQKRKTSP